ncbi:MAG: AAA family ATPase [Bacteroidota bacterium]
MIQKVSITHFKSIKQLSLEAKRVNIFIGKPNVGKSNLLEALGLFSLSHGNQGQIRYKDYNNLFYDNDLSQNIVVAADDFTCLVSPGNNIPAIHALNEKDSTHNLFDYYIQTNDLRVSNHGMIKYYLFRVLEQFEGYYTFLEPPYGKNLFQVLSSNKKLRSIVSEILVDQGSQLLLRQQDREIEIAKVIDQILYAYPYQTLSDTLQRLVFYLAAIKTNKNSTLLFEEPENNLFPFYSKYLAEEIAEDTDNQYFLVTHNPYFLLSLAEKTNKDDLQIFITYLEDYQTKVKLLNSDEVSELLDLDASIFFNLDTFLEGESVH